MEIIFSADDPWSVTPQLNDLVQMALQMKSNFSQDHFIDMCELVYNKMRHL